MKDVDRHTDREAEFKAGAAALREGQTDTNADSPVTVEDLQVSDTDIRSKIVMDGSVSDFGEETTAITCALFSGNRAIQMAVNSPVSNDSQVQIEDLCDASSESLEALWH